MNAVSEAGHGVTGVGSTGDSGDALATEPSIDLDRDAARDTENWNDFAGPDSLGNMVVFNKLEIDKFKADKKHKKAPYVRRTGGCVVL